MVIRQSGKKNENVPGKNAPSRKPPLSGQGNDGKPWLAGGLDKVKCLCSRHQSCLSSLLLEDVLLLCCSTRRSNGNDSEKDNVRAVIRTLGAAQLSARLTHLFLIDARQSISAAITGWETMSWGRYTRYQNALGGDALCDDDIHIAAHATTGMVHTE